MSREAEHEAAHAATAIALGRRVERIEREIGHVEVGEQLGYCRVPLGDRIEANQVVIQLAGYLANALPGWPPSYEEAKAENLEGLSLTMKALRVTREAYAEMVQLSRDVLFDPRVRELVAALARALDAVPTLYEAEINEIAEAHGFAIPEPKEPDSMQRKYLETGEGIALDSGYFEALVASFNTIDRGGDVIRPGAFRNTPRRWQASGKRIPVIWSHEASDPAKVIGGVDPAKARETDEGLAVQGKLDLSSATAREVLRLLKSGDVSGWSFGYTVPPDGQREGGDYREITEIDLLEVGPCVSPMNPATRTLAAKSDDSFRQAAAEILATPLATEAKAAEPLRIVSFPC